MTLDLAELDAAAAHERALHAAAVRGGYFGRRDAERDREAVPWQALSDYEVAPPGLVSVPTSDTRRAHAPFAVQAASAAIRDALDAFTIDREAHRLAKLRRAVGFAARGHMVSERGRRSDQVLMVTLTYSGSNDEWHARHISEFLKRVRHWLLRRRLPFRYVWVAELQQRGVIHYHAAIWVPRGLKLPMPDRQGWWPYGMTRIEVARNAIPYLLKYLSKETSKTFGRFPKGARLYGVGGLDHSMRRARRWLGLPAFVQANSDMHDDWRRAKGGGWTAPDGTHWPSEVRREWIGHGYALRRVHRHPRSIDAAGPFMWLSHAKGALQ